MLVRLDAADQLARVVASRPSVPVAEAARILLALPGEPGTVARRVLDRVVAADARLELCEGAVRLASSPLAEQPLERAAFCVVDLETTALSAREGVIAEVGAVRVSGGAVARELEIVGSRARSERAMRLLFRFAGDAVLAGHNVGFDLRFLERVVASRGERVAAPVVDTLVLARRLLRGRTSSFSLAALAELLGTSETPCHRALPDARAAAKVLLALVALARERGARTVGDLCALSRPATLASSAA